MKLFRASNIIKFIFFTAVLFAAYIAYQVYQSPYDIKITATDAPIFRNIGVDFKHELVEASSLPYAASAALDLDNDNIPELFLGGGFRQRDGVFKFNEGVFEDITISTGFLKDFGDATYGAASVDVNKDGFADLFVTRDSGVYLYLNIQGAWQRQKLEISFDPRFVPVSISLVDANKDGFVDLLISNQIRSKFLFKLPSFNKVENDATAQFLLNNGDNTFRDATRQAGLSDLKNINTAAFADLNGDGKPDLMAASSSQGVMIYENKGDAIFKPISTESDNFFAYALGLAVGDYNNDGRLDIFAANVGSSVPAILARGDLTEGQRLNQKWTLLRNDGGFRFTNTAEESYLANYELGRGAAFADFDLDGLLDLVVETNHIVYPPHRYYKNPGKLLLQNSDGQFVPVQMESRVENKELGVAPIVADFNNDGNLDIVHVNVNAAPAAHINETSVRRYLKVDLGNGVDALGAKVILETANQAKQYRTLLSGEGLSSDQVHIAHFGLGSETEINKIEVHYLSGRVIVVNNPEPNTTINVPALVAGQEKSEMAEGVSLEETVNDTWLSRHPMTELQTQPAVETNTK